MERMWGLVWGLVWGRVREWRKMAQGLGCLNVHIP